HFLAFVNIKSNELTHFGGYFYYIIFNGSRFNKSKRFFTHGTGIIMIPFLALLTHIYSVQQIWAWPYGKLVCNCPKVRYWYVFDGRFFQEKVPDGSVRCFCKFFNLFKRRFYITTFPIRQLWKTMFQCGKSKTGTFSC